MANVQLSDLNITLSLQDADLIHVKTASDGVDRVILWEDFTLPPANAIRVAFENLGDVASDNIVPLVRGGTGATTASGARTALGLQNLATYNASVYTLSLLDATNASAAQNVLDVYPKASVYTKTESDGRYAQRSNNLSDLASVSTARTNLDVYSKTESNTNYLAKSSNLSDVPNKATARTNLDVYSKSEGDGRYCQRSNNLGDVSNIASARTNLSVYSKSEGDARYLLETNNLSDLTNKTTARNNLQLGTSNNVTFNSVTAGTFNSTTTSDIRLKKKLRPVKFDYKAIDKIRFVQGYYNNEARDDLKGHKFFGVIAQDVRDAFPRMDCWGQGEDGYLWVDYPKLNFYLEWAERQRPVYSKLWRDIKKLFKGE